MNPFYVPRSAFRVRDLKFPARASATLRATRNAERGTRNDHA
jgi:hypothetical protein